ncbi:MAG: aldehyde dehydrogenase family protein [Casimicrobiaceae bacterium]
MGPRAIERQIVRVVAMVEAGVKAATLLTGGRPVRVAGCDGGYFDALTPLADVGPEMGVAREEIFGPAISVLAYDDADSTSSTARSPTATCPSAE